MMRFRQNGAVSSTVKKKAQHGAVLNDTMGLLLPLNAQRQGKKKFFFPAFSRSLSFPKPENKLDKDPPLA
jgi:hypothetical protein